MGLQTLGALGDRLARGIAGRMWGKSGISVEGKTCASVSDTSFSDSQPCPTGGPNTEILAGGPCDFGGEIWAHTDADVWADFDEADLLTIYRLNAVVYACVTMIATSYAEPPLELGREKADGEWIARTPTQVPMLNVVAKPNAWYSLNDLEQVNMKRKLLTGAAFTWKWRNNAGEVTELWPVPTNIVTMSVGKCGIAGYWLNKDTKSELWVPAEDMMFDRFQSVESIFGYTAPLIAALHAYEIDSKREEYLISMISNLSAPGMIIEQNAPDGIQRGGLTGKQADDFRASAKALGIGKPLIFPPGLTAKFPGVVEDLDWSGVEGDVASRICMVFGVPPILIGARVGIKHSTYANYGEARLSFYDETLKPLWAAGGETWTRSMLTTEADLGNLAGRVPQNEFRYILDDVAELQEDQNELMDRGIKALAGGGILVNEFRTKFARLQTQPDGDVYLRQSSVIVEPVADSADARAETAAPPEDTEAPPDVEEVEEDEG